MVQLFSRSLVFQQYYCRLDSVNLHKLPFHDISVKYHDTVGRLEFMVWTVWPLRICLSVAAIAMHYITFPSMPTCCRRNIVVSLTYLYMMKKFTPSGAFGFYAGLVVLCYPEVSGLALEEIGHIQTWIWHSVECAHAKSPKVALER
ncbi:hypothetical protein LIPSTDRAFT_75022 [Lipomyces starkeyi NRRL Y-11557]|uniref:Uncharacterized protein n=1 Tax=Lipomyces starkeyi NRRL Y-11557 TaxID=675824 RepID=A0A1E3PYQ4_LIPST|nr:hypothetical protein LIPSTDRAFT_75022 [Lipomyces starkeyi NRRL Y-11557]